MESRSTFLRTPSSFEMGLTMVTSIASTVGGVGVISMTVGGVGVISMGAVWEGREGSGMGAIGRAVVATDGDAKWRCTFPASAHHGATKSGGILR